MLHDLIHHERYRLWRFIAIGCLAAAVHWTGVMLLVKYGHLPPLGANVLGWLMALTVSFLGHFGITFRGHDTPFKTAAARFFMISAMGFGINESAYAVLLHWDGHHHGFWLATVLVSVACLTYWFSRHWAFLRSSERPVS